MREKPCQLTAERIGYSETEDVGAGADRPDPGGSVKRTSPSINTSQPKRVLSPPDGANSVVSS